MPKLTFYTKPQKIAYCYNRDELNGLSAFNELNSNYVLIYSSGLVANAATGENALRYRHYNNCEVLIENQKHSHTTGDPESHLDGKVRQTGKFLGVLDFNGANPPDSKHLESREKLENGLRVYQGRVKVISSERQNRMVVCALD